MSDFDAGTTANPPDSGEEAASPPSTVDEQADPSAPASEPVSPEHDLIAKLRLEPTQNVLDTIRGWIAHHFG